MNSPIRLKRALCFGLVRSSLGALVLPVLALLFVNCAGTGKKTSSQAVHIQKEDLLVLETIQLPDSAQGTLESYGWDTARFAQEWRKELHFQLRRAGIATTDDSAKSSVRLRILVHSMRREGGPQIDAVASLIRPEGSKSFPVQTKAKGGEETGERSDPTVDRLRLWSSQITKECLRNPKAEEKRKQEYVPQVFMVF